MRPTVNLELAYLAAFAEKLYLRAAAGKALRSLWTQWQIEPANLVPVDHDIVEVMAGKLRFEKLLPADEVHDSLIIAEATLLGCRVLLTSGAHQRGIDFERLTLLLRGFDVATPAIATPCEIVHKNFH